jgi:hypothetical protein
MTAAVERGAGAAGGVYGMYTIQDEARACYQQAWRRQSANDKNKVKIRCGI